MLYKYRYLNERSVGMVLRPELFFAKPESLNDPLELEALLQIAGTKVQVAEHLREYLSALQESLSQEIEDLKGKLGRYEDGDLSIYSGYHRRLSRVEIFKERIKHCEELIAEVEAGSDAAAEDLLRKFYDDLLAPLRQSGICSLAGAPDNELMWAHYGDEHRGVCFEFQESLFEQARKVIKREVLYSGTGVIDPLEQGYLKTFNLLFSTKSLAWRYENETRFFIFGDPRAVAISHEHLESVVLGYRFFLTGGATEKKRKEHRAYVAQMANNISSINKSRPKGMKLKIKQVVRDLYRFAVEECDTGQVLERMRKFALERP